MLASFFGAAVSCICLYVPLMLWWRLFFGSIAAFVVSIGCIFKGKKTKEIYGRYLCIAFLMAILLGGSIGLLQKRMGEDTFSFWQMLVLPPVLSFFLKRILQRHLPKKARLLYDVILFFGEKQYVMKGLLDTGNSLVDPISKKAVSIASREVFVSDLEKEGLINGFPPERFRAIPYHSVGKKNGILCGYEMDCLMIDTDERKIIIEKPVIGISEVPVGSSKTYQIILQPELLREGER